MLKGKLQALWKIKNNTNFKQHFPAKDKCLSPKKRLYSFRTFLEFLHFITGFFFFYNYGKNIRLMNFYKMS